jgi:hypothetical protein
MGESYGPQSSAEELAVCRQPTAAEERCEFSTRLKHAYAQHISACAFIRRSPERRVSPQLRCPCERAVSLVG